MLHLIKHSLDNLHEVHHLMASMSSIIDKEILKEEKDQVTTKTELIHFELEDAWSHLRDLRKSLWDIRKYWCDPENFGKRTMEGFDRNDI